MSTPEWVWVDPLDLRPGMVVYDPEQGEQWLTVCSVEHTADYAPGHYGAPTRPPAVPAASLGGPQVDSRATSGGLEPLQVVRGTIHDIYEPVGSEDTATLMVLIHDVANGIHGPGRIDSLRAIAAYALGVRPPFTQPENGEEDYEVPDYTGAPLLNAELSVSQLISLARDAHGRGDASGVVNACAAAASAACEWERLLPEEVADDEF